MQTFIAVWSLVLQLLPLLVQMVKAVEQQFPEAGQGARKLQMVREALQNTFTTMEETRVTFDQVWPALQSLIATAVAIFNATGQFKKS